MIANQFNVTDEVPTKSSAQESETTSETPGVDTDKSKESSPLETRSSVQPTAPSESKDQLSTDKPAEKPIDSGKNEIPPADAQTAAPEKTPETKPVDKQSEASTTDNTLINVEGLNLSLPDGTVIVSGVNFELRAGQVVTLLGPSGAGKTTLLRAIFSPEELTARGYKVDCKIREVNADAAHVPQRGALFDHLDVAGNIALAQFAGGQAIDPGKWLQAVDLDPASIGAKGRSVAMLSGGQAQRVAIARTLASGRKILVLDEPSVGLDPLGVRMLAQLLIKEAQEHDVSVLVITHDLTLAAGASDKIYFLQPAERTLIPIALDHEGPAEKLAPEQRQTAVSKLEVAVEKLLRQERPAAKGGHKKRKRNVGDPGVLQVAGASILRGLHPRWMRPASVVFRRASAQSLLRPLPFYAIVGALLGFTVLYVIAKMSSDLRAAAMLRLVGGTYILSLAPPLSAILFAATSGNAVNAWLGSMQLNRQVLALEGIGVPKERYLWAPAWFALVISYLVSVLAFIAAMTFGGWILFHAYNVPGALAVLTSDFLDPSPNRIQFLVRGLWLIASYAVAIASIVVSRGMATKEEANDVTSGMTGAVILATLFVVAMELLSVMVLFAVRGR